MGTYLKISEEVKKTEKIIRYIKNAKKNKVQSVSLQAKKNCMPSEKATIYVIIIYLSKIQVEHCRSQLCLGKVDFFFFYSHQNQLWLIRVRQSWLWLGKAEFIFFKWTSPFTFIGRTINFSCKKYINYFTIMIVITQTHFLEEFFFCYSASFTSKLKKKELTFRNILNWKETISRNEMY